MYVYVQWQLYVMYMCNYIFDSNTLFQEYWNTVFYRIICCIYKAQGLALAKQLGFSTGFSPTLSALSNVKPPLLCGIRKLIVKEETVSWHHGMTVHVFVVHDQRHSQSGTVVVCWGVILSEWKSPRSQHQ